MTEPEEPLTLHQINVLIRDKLAQGLPHLIDQTLVTATQTKNMQARMTAVRSLLALAKEVGAIEIDPVRTMFQEMADELAAAKQDEEELPKSLTKS
jgi:hypothetical protein